MPLFDDCSPAEDSQPASLLILSQGQAYKPKIAKVDVSPELHGSVLKFRDAVRTSLAIKSGYLRIEADLMDQKWFDYRFMTPAEATQVFIYAYERIRDEMNKRHIGAGSIKLFPRYIWQMPDKLRSGFWSARQQADALGMKYDQFVRYTMGYWFDSGQCGTKKLRMPLPNQLFRTAALRSAEERWDTHIREVRLEYSTLPQYRVEEYAGLPAQDAHKAWLITRLRMRSPSNRSYGLAEFVFSERLLSEEDVVVVFGPVELENARKVAKSSGSPALSDEDFSLFPGCYGMPGVKSDICDSCIQQRYCGKDAKRVSEAVANLSAAFESADERKRRLARERKRKERARKGKSTTTVSASITLGTSFLLPAHLS
ncbi:MAG: hypothetical protein RH942_03790 [Kiloniellaceae bacterium]